MTAVYFRQIWYSLITQPRIVRFRYSLQFVTEFDQWHPMYYNGPLNAGRSSQEKAARPSVCSSVRLSNACIITKRKKDLSRFLYHKKII